MRYILGKIWKERRRAKVQRGLCSYLAPLEMFPRLTHIFYTLPDKNWANDWIPTIDSQTSLASQAYLAEMDPLAVRKVEIESNIILTLSIVGQIDLLTLAKRCPGHRETGVRVDGEGNRNSCVLVALVKVLHHRSSRASKNDPRVATFSAVDTSARSRFLTRHVDSWSYTREIMRIA